MSTERHGTLPGYGHYRKPARGAARHGVPLHLTFVRSTDMCCPDWLSTALRLQSPALWRWGKFAVFTGRAMPSRPWRDWQVQPLTMRP